MCYLSMITLDLLGFMWDLTVNDYFSNLILKNLISLIFSSNFKNWLKINTPPKSRFFKAMAAPNLQATVFNLIFDNFASTTKCLVPMPVLGGLSPFEVLLSLIIMRISIPLVVVFTHAYGIIHLTIFLPVAYHVFLVIVPHIKASVVLTPQLLAHILHDMLALMNIFSPFQILPVPLLLLTLVSLFFFEPCSLELSPSTSSPLTTRVPPTPPCHFLCR